MSIKTFLENFINQVYPALKKEYEAKKSSLDAFKGELIDAVSDDEVWNEAKFPRLKEALMSQLQQIQVAQRRFIQEEEEVNEYGEFVFTALFQPRPSFKKGALVIDTGVDKQPVSSLIAHLQWIIDHVDDAVEEARNGAFIMEVTSSPLKEAFGHDVAGFIEVEATEKFMKKR